MLNILYWSAQVSIVNFGGGFKTEYRKYENKEDFKHYRAFFLDSDRVYSYFEKYMNDEEIDTEKWIDVTEEFEE